MHPCTNTWGGRAWSIDATTVVSGRIERIVDRDARNAIVWIRPRTNAQIDALRRWERDPPDVRWSTERPPPLRSCWDEAASCVWVSWPMDPEPPRAFRPGTRVSVRLRCAGYHAFSKGHGFVWRVERATFVRDSLPCLFASATG